MKARPILFSSPMIQALLDGRKTVTRRVAKPQPIGCLTAFAEFAREIHAGQCERDVWIDEDETQHRCRYGKPGDLLYARETWQRVYDTDGRGKEYSVIQPSGPRVPNLERIIYRATDDRDDPAGPRFPWRPAIHMPRSASRLTLRITDVRVERLQEISEADARAEGVSFGNITDQATGEIDRDAVEAYEQLWESINGKGSWAANPWVFVIAFETIQANVDDVMKRGER